LHIGVVAGKFMVFIRFLSYVGCYFLTIWAFPLITKGGLSVPSFCGLAYRFIGFIGFAECFAFHKRLSTTIP